MSVDPGPAPSLSDAAYARLKQEILENRMPPGFQALEPELALRLGMSRTPVREALVRLQADGLVDVVPRRGMRVRALTPGDVHEIYEALACIEAEAAAILAERRPLPAAVAPLDAAVAAMEAAVMDDDLAAWTAAADLFHRRLLELAGNRRLARIAEGLHDQAQRARAIALKLADRPMRATRDYRALIDAILTGAPDMVRRTCRETRQRVGAEVIEALQRFGLHHL